MTKPPSSCYPSDRRLCQPCLGNQARAYSQYGSFSSCSCVQSYCVLCADQGTRVRPYLKRTGALPAPLQPVLLGEVAWLVQPSLTWNRSRVSIPSGHPPLDPSLRMHAGWAVKKIKDFCGVFPISLRSDDLGSICVVLPPTPTLNSTPPRPFQNIGGVQWITHASWLRTI